MLKTMDIVKEKDFPIAGRQSTQSAFNGHAVNNTGLRTVISAKTAPGIGLRDFCHHLIE